MQSFGYGGHAAVLHRMEKRGHGVYECSNENFLQLFPSYYKRFGIDSFAVAESGAECISRIGFKELPP